MHTAKENYARALYSQHEWTHLKAEAVIRTGLVASFPIFVSVCSVHITRDGAAILLLLILVIVNHPKVRQRPSIQDAIIKKSCILPFCKNGSLFIHESVYVIVKKFQMLPNCMCITVFSGGLLFSCLCM